MDRVMRALAKRLFALRCGGSNSAAAGNGGELASTTGRPTGGIEHQFAAAPEPQRSTDFTPC